jgi:Ca2+-binding EF-hand superfamily protein
MEGAEFIEFQAIRASIKFDASEFLNTYLNEIHKDFIERGGGGGGGITRSTFYDYMKIPIFISNKLFASLDKDEDGLLNLREFSSGLFLLYQGDYEETAQIIFNIFDFNKDGVIHKHDVKLLLSYLPLKDEFNACHKKQMETLDELEEIVNASFSKADGIDFKAFLKVVENIKSDIYIQLLCFLYQNKPFQIASVNLFRNYRRRRSTSFSSPKKTETVKLRLISPSKNTRINCFDNFRININPICNTDPDNTSSPEKHEKMVLKPPVKKVSYKDTNTYFHFEAAKRDSPTNQPKCALRKPSVTPIKGSKGVLARVSLPPIQQPVKALSKKPSFMDKSQSPMGRKKNPIEFFKMVNPPSKFVAQRKEESVEFLRTSKNFLNASPSPTKTVTRLRVVNSEEPVVKDIELKLIDTADIAGDVATHEDYIWLLDSNSKKMKKHYMVLIGRELSIYDVLIRDELIQYHNLSGCYITVDEKHKIIDKEKYKSFIILFNKTVVKEIYIGVTQTSFDQWAQKLKKAIGYRNFEDMYDITQDIGEGKFGAVKLGVSKQTGEKVAIKFIKKDSLEQDDFELIKTEIDLMKLFRHPNLVKLLDNFESDEYIYIVMEFLNGGDMLSYIKKKKILNERRAAKVIYNIALGVSYLNAFGIVHRDLKPENLMLVDTSDSSSVKIIDFGLTRTVAHGEKMKERLGTINYVAPEILSKQPYGKQIDIWSMGTILYLMLAGYLPFDDISNSDEKIIEKTIHMEPSYPDEVFGKVSKGAIRLINQCLEKNPEKRISIEGFLKNEWLKKNVN